MKRSGRPNIAKRLIHHYRWMIVDEDTHESRVSMRINMLNLLLAGAFLTLLVASLTLLALRYSPLKSYFVEETVNFDAVKSKKELLQLNEKMIALEDSLARNTLFLEHLQKVVSGDLKAAEVRSLMAAKTSPLPSGVDFKASEEDSLFRAQIAKEELEAMKNSPTQTSGNFLYPPVRGVVTGKYDLTENHLATDIAAKIGEEVKVIANGSVVFADWSPDTGNSIIVQHKDEMMSVYKHCSKLFRKVGDEVEKGDVIAAVGNSGELTTGPHLHFELWIQGKLVDAEQYIDF